MPYYVGGDYYQGDYYQGDFFGSLARGFVGAATGFLAGGPAGAIIGGVRGIASGGTVSKGQHPSLPVPGIGIPNVGPTAPGMNLVPLQAPSQTGIVNIGGTGPQAGIFNLAGPGPIVQPSLMAGGGPTPLKGYHLNKSTYETRGGGTSRWPRELELHPKHTVLVRNRRMNVGNARALKRALRRAGGFARLARRVMSFTHPRAGRGHFKIRRRGKR